MSTIFISHSSKNNDIAKEIERRLAQQGHISVFLDLDPEKGIVAGQSWERTLYRKLRACRAVIALCTDDYLRSQWCFAEIALARMEGKQIFALKSEPLAENSKMPSILTEKQFIDIRINPEDAYRRLWRGLDEIDLLGVSGEWDPKNPPYLGLNAFHEKHAPIFFGREEEARAGIEMLDRGAPGLIMALGPSGSGKSSLVRAGMVPRLRRIPDHWLIVDPIRPGQDPFRELATSLIGTYRRYAPESIGKLGDPTLLSGRLQAWSTAESVASAVPKEADRFADDERVKRLLNQLSELHQAPPSGAEGSFLNFLDWSLDDLRRICDGSTDAESTGLFTGSTPLVDIVRDLRRTSKHPDARVLLVVDQFEELLGHEGDNDSARDFLELIRTSVEAEDSPVMVLGTMRSDFLGLFQRHPILRGIDFESLSLGPMKPDGMRKIIEAPAKLGALELEEGLVDRLIADTETPDALPLLSFTLWVLWRDFRENGKIEICEYDRIGGLHGAIAREADALLGNANEEALRRAFVRMARLNDEGNFARQPVAWDSPDLVPIHEVLERFLKSRLLVDRTEDNKRTVEVAHEALFRCLEAAEKLVGPKRAEILLMQQISRDARTWSDARRDEDNLWRGVRLQQASALLKGGKLEGQDKEFVAKGVQRQRRQGWSLAGITIIVFVGMVILTVWAVAAKTKLGKEYENMILNVMPLAWPEGAVPGNIELIELSEGKLDRVRRVDSAGVGKNLAILGHWDKGRVVVAAHDGFISAAQKSHIFLDLAIKWSTFESQKTKILFTVGHCETVSESPWPESAVTAPAKAIEEWGYSLEPIQNLAEPALLGSAGLLIVGNAWSEFAREEIDAVVNFVADGGSLLMVGLLWSFQSNPAWSFQSDRDPEHRFRPCKFNKYSENRFAAKGNYPMNDLAGGFGIKFLPGFQNR